MIRESLHVADQLRRSLAFPALAVLLTCFLAAPKLLADEPYARSRDYDLQHSKISLRFDLEQKKVLGEVTHSLSILRDGTAKIVFDSAGLTIQKVTVNKAAAKFETTAEKLIIPLASEAKAGDKFEITIRYEGRPTKGMYFILPDKDYPDRPRQIWTQGESEDTHYYLPTYDYPNDRLTTEMILTVPASWITVSNGKLVSVSDAGKGLKAWYWKESVPSSTYLITVVAGEFDEVKESWHGITVTYYVPKGRGDRLPINYGRTPAMMELFSKKIGVDYPWEKYAQVMVDDFVAGGMENSSATTNTSSSLVHPKLAPEYFTGEDDLISHELRHQLGEDGFYRGLKHYLEANRGKNVVTADLAKAVEEATHTNVDQFFSQWLYGAGAPKFDLSYSYDAEKHQVALTVKQTQTVEGRVGLFRVPVEVEITTASGPKLYNVTVSKEKQTFPLPADSVPLMVLFDKGGHLLKSTEFHKEKKEWLYQLKNATNLADRADAVLALGKMKKDEEVVGALGEALRNDKAWGVRATAADTLGQLVGASASKVLLAALDSNDKPWVRSRVVSALGNFNDDAAIVAKLNAVAKQDDSYRARAAALQALGKLKTSTAFATLEAAVNSDSPDGMLRNAALYALGSLGDDKAVPILLKWSAPGKPIDSRKAAISNLARLQKDNQDITKQIAAYLAEPHFSIRMAAIYALGTRGDATAIPALEALLKSDDLSIEMAPMIKGQIARLKRPADGKPRANQGYGDNEEAGENAGS